MKACRAAALAHSAPSARGHNQVTNSQLIAHRISGAVGKFIFPKLRTPQGGRLSVRARDRRGSSIHTRLGFMQRRLVKIEIISDTI